MALVISLIDMFFSQSPISSPCVVLPYNASINQIDLLGQSLSSSPPINVYLLVNLDEHNYMIWKDQLLIYVTTYGLEVIINGT